MNTNHNYVRHSPSHTRIALSMWAVLGVLLLAVILFHAVS